MPTLPLPLPTPLEINNNNSHNSSHNSNNNIRAAGEFQQQRKKGKIPSRNEFTAIGKNVEYGGGGGAGGGACLAMRPDAFRRSPAETTSPWQMRRSTEPPSSNRRSLSPGLFLSHSFHCCCWSTRVAVVIVIIGGRGGGGWVGNWTSC